MQNKKANTETIIQILRELEGEKTIQNDYTKAHDKLIVLLDEINEILKNNGKENLIEELEKEVAETVSLAREQYFKYGIYFCDMGLCF